MGHVKSWNSSMTTRPIKYVQVSWFVCILWKHEVDKGNLGEESTIKSYSPQLITIYNYIKISVSANPHVKLVSSQKQVGQQSSLLLNPQNNHYFFARLNIR